MGRGFNKKFNFALSLLLLSSTAFGLESEYKNSLSKIELTKTGDSVYNINLHTQKDFLEPIRIIKKSDLNYYILLPETKNNVTQTASNTSDIRNITTNSYPYAGADINNGYTKININTTKPINFNVNIKNSTTTSSASVELKDKLANKEETKVEEKIQKKNSDFQKEKTLLTKASNKKKAEKIKNNKTSRKEEGLLTRKRNVEPKELKIEDVIKQEIESLKEQQKLAKNSAISEEEFILQGDIPTNNDEILEEYSEDIAAAGKIEAILPEFEDIDAQNIKMSFKEKLSEKLSDYGLSLKDAFLMLLAILASFFAMFFALNKKPNQAKLKSKADLIEKLDKQDGLVAKEPIKKPENKGQYFIFDKNIKQTGFCDPATSATKKNYELSHYDPDLRKNYNKVEIEQYQTKEVSSRKTQENGEYDIIQKILKEDAIMDVPTTSYNTTVCVEPKVEVQLVSSPIAQTQTKVQEKIEETTAEPTILSNVEIAPERGFMCVSYNDNINLMGYIFDEVFPIYNFKCAKLENYDIKFRLSEKDDKGANFIIKVGNTRLITRVTKSSMNLEVVM